MRILVIGANGKVGRRLLPLLVEEGHDVRAMVRDAGQVPEMEARGATAVVADLEGDFAHALEGCDAVVFTAGSGGQTGADKTAAIDGLGAVLTVNAALEHRVRRFVMVSSRGADDPDRSKGIRHYLVAKAIADGYLQQSGLDYTIVRPGRLTEEDPTGRIRIGDDLGSGGVSRGNVAATLAAALRMPSTVGRTFEVLDGEETVEEALG